MPDYIEAAKIEVKLWREHLALPDVRPKLEEAVWVEDIACGPDLVGLHRLQQIQKEYGFSHVTTGNAAGPVAKGSVCGVYVRSSAKEEAINPLRDYLSRDT